jgi:hypothetical protein
MIRCTVKKVSGWGGGKSLTFSYSVACVTVGVPVLSIICALLYMVYSNSEFKSATPYNGTNKYDIKFTSPPVSVVYYYMLQLVNLCTCELYYVPFRFL